MIVVPQYKESPVLDLPCVVHCIEYEKQLVLDIIQHRDQLFKKGDELSYKGIIVTVHKKVSDKPIQTSSNAILNRTDFRKVRYFCNKK